MFNDCFFNYLLTVSENYDEAQDVLNSFDTLAGSINYLQNKLIEEVKDSISIDNIDLSVRRLESIKILGVYGEKSFGKISSHNIIIDSSEFFENVMGLK